MAIGLQVIPCYSQAEFKWHVHPRCRRIGGVDLDAGQIVE